MGDSVTPEGRDLANSLKLATVAVVSAVVTATLVIGAGQALMRRSPPSSATPSPALVIPAGG